MAANTEQIKAAIIETIKTVYDPEIPVSIWEMGLIYDIQVKESGEVYLEMTLTTPACPVAESLPMQVQEKVSTVEGVTDVDLRVVWEPAWDKSRMSEEARFALDML